MELIHGVFLAVVLGHVATVNGLYDRNSDVVELTAGNFQGKVLDSDDLWLVEFYAPWCGHCKSLAPEWSKAAAALKGVVKVGAVNMDDHGSVGQPYGIQGFPSIKVFGADKKKPVDYESARTASAIVAEALNQVKKLVNGRLGGGGSRSSGGSRSGGGGGDGFAAEEVVALTDSNFEQLVLDSDDMWLVAFHAPWCGHCKSLAPHWATAAHELKGKVKLGAVDATADTVYSSRYGVKGFPTIKLFNQGKKDGDAQEYDGGRTSSDIVSWALDKLSAKIEPPEIIQVTEKTTLETACQKNPLCIVSILPHILDCQSDCRNGYLKVLRELGARYKKQLWGWVWAEAGAQPDLEEALGIGGFGYPAMAALNARKMKFALLRGAFSDAGIHEFLRELSVGRGSTAPLRGAELPRVAATTPWDGKDGEMPAEDEYDLSDVELEPLDKDEL